MFKKVLCLNTFNFFLFASEVAWCSGIYSRLWIGDRRFESPTGWITLNLSLNFAHDRSYLCLDELSKEYFNFIKMLLDLSLSIYLQ